MHGHLVLGSLASTLTCELDNSLPFRGCPIRSKGFSGGSEVKASARNAGGLGSIPGSGRFPGEGNSNPFQYFCLENPMDEEAWWATVHGVTKSRTRLSDFTYLLTTRSKMFSSVSGL